jgi:pyrroline-5-carboxylate reductase
MTYELAILGAGNMAEAIARGILRANLLRPDQIIAADLSPARRDLFTQDLKITTVENPIDAAQSAQTLLLSVKPQHMAALLASIAPHISPDTLILSIAAGKSSSFIAQHLNKPAQRVVRIMPNTPMLIGEGMSAISPGQHATPADLACTRRIFESGGAVIEVPEDKMDAVTAISGSGPAYFFFLVEQMIQAGLELGLTPEQSHLLSTRTALGAAKMLTTSPDSPAELRRKVTSPNGTTQAAIETMQARQVPEAIVAALHRAAERSKELSA